MKFNKGYLLWLIISIMVFSLCWVNSSAVSTVLLAVKGTIIDGNLVKFSGTAGVAEDAGLSAADVVKCKFDATTAPTVNNDIDEGYSIGSRWLDVTNDKSYVCLDTTDGAAIWHLDVAGPGSSTDHAIVRWDGTAGEAVINSVVTVSDAGVVAGGTWNGAVVSSVYGGTGIANNVASTITISGNFATTFTVTGVTGVTLPESGTLCVTTGTPETTFQIDDDNSGPKIKNSAGELQARNAADDAFANFRALSFYGDGSNLTGVGATAATALTVSAKAAENIAKGEVVYISGATGQTPEVSLADNTNSAKHQFLGIAAETKTTGQTILIRVRGELVSLDTSSFTDGDILYLSTAGAITKTIPTSGAIEIIGYCSYSHASLGKIIVMHHTVHGAYVPAGVDIIHRLGDSAGSNKISYRDYDNNEIASLDSDGEYLSANMKRNKLDATSAPTVNNDTDEGYEVGSYWFDVTNDKSYACLDITDGAAVWIEITSLGTTTFLGLTDTPGSYSGEGGKYVLVNVGEDALEFGAVAGEANTVSNIGFVSDATTSKVYKQKTGVDFELRVLKEGIAVEFDWYEVTGNWDLANASYDSKLKDTTPQDSDMTDVFIGSTGSKMYTVGHSNDRVYEYTLSTPYDVTTASYVQYYTPTEVAWVSQLFFSSNGEKMYVLDYDSDTIFQYVISSAWNISTASYDSKSFSVNSEEPAPTGFCLGSNGFKLYVIGSTAYVHQYTLSSAWDINTAGYDSKEKDLSPQDSYPIDAFISSDGTVFFVVGNSNDKVYQYAVGTPYDVTTISYSKDFALGITVPKPYGFCFSLDGDKFYIMDNTDDDVHQYSITGATNYYDYIEIGIVPEDIKLDDFGAPDDNTDNDASTSAHGLMPKLPFSGDLLSTTTVAFNADADTTLYTVPTGKRCVLSHAIVVAAADAGGTTTVSIGQNTAETDFVPANTLSNLDAQYDSVILMPIPNTTPLKIKSYAADTVIEAQVASQSGAAGNTIYLFGILY